MLQTNYEEPGSSVKLQLSPDKRTFVYDKHMDPEAVPICDQLNTLNGCQTIYCCAGHFDHDAEPLSRNEFECAHHVYFYMLCDRIETYRAILDIFKGTEARLIKWETDVASGDFYRFPKNVIPVSFHHHFDCRESRDIEFKRIVDALYRFNNPQPKEEANHDRT